MQLVGPCSVHGLYMIHLECWFVFLDFNHHVVNIHEFRAYGQVGKRPLWEDLVKTMIILDQLCQRSLHTHTQTVN